jgi:tetratricopeptide (TPR) repeat protein/transcriptional regulator with XRE-family HTH domain
MSNGFVEGRFVGGAALDGDDAPEGRVGNGRASVGVEFGRLVRLIRADRGLSQEELADRSGLSVRTIRNLEQGRRRRRSSTVVLLMDALSLTDAERVAVQHAAGGADAGLDGAAIDDGERPRVMDIPMQLPAGVAGFAGRARELARLDEVLAAPADAQAGVAVCVVVGVAGVGKTALAVHWAHRVADEFPDGQLYVNLRGFGPGGPMSPGEALRGFLGAFGLPPQRIPADVDGQAALYRSVLAGRQVLVVLDNAANAGQVGLLLPGSPRCVVVVTSREALTGLVSAVDARLLTLDLPTADEARDLLASRLGRERVAAEPDAAAQLIARCARLPLALSVVAARAVAHDGFPLSVLADELRDVRHDLGALGGGDPSTDVRAVFSWSYRILGADAARLFRLLASHPGPDIATPAVASLAGVSPGWARRLLAELARAHLVVEHVPRRYAFHDLLRAYAAELGLAAAADDRRAAQRRLLDHYLHTAYHATMLLYPHQDPITVAAPQPGVTPQDLPDPEGALAWFTGERPVLLAAVEQAHQAGFPAHAWQLAWALTEPLRRAGRWHELAACRRTALEAAEQLGDPAMRAHARREQGSACASLGRHAEAHAHLELALHRFAELGDDAGQAHTHLEVAVLLAGQADHEQALGHAEQALDLYRSADHKSGQAYALNGIGWDHMVLGNPKLGLTYCTQALAVQREIGDRRGQADTLDSLGYAHHHLHDHPQARVCYEQAIALYRELGDRRGEADTLTHLGDTHHAAGETEAAAHAWRQALTILDHLDHPDADRLRARLRQHTPGP